MTTRKRLKTQLLVNKLAAKQAEAVSRLTALMPELRAIRKLLDESDDLQSEIENFAGSLPGYSDRLQVAVGIDIESAMTELRDATRMAKTFVAAAPKLKVEKFLRYWGEVEDDEPELTDEDFEDDAELAALAELPEEE